MKSRIKCLLEPMALQSLSLKNRIVMPPMDCNFAGLDGEVTDRMIAHYEQRAKGGVGLIIVEATSVVGKIKNLVLQPTIHDDGHIPGFGNLVEAIHAWGAKTFLQIVHAGGEAGIGPLFSSSDVTSRIMGGVPTPLTVGQIEDVVEQFVQAARRAKIAGFDGVEVHAAHGYLLNQFMSPFYNRRTDLYGGSVENRGRFTICIIERIKKELGQGFPVCVRISADEYIEGGLTVDESKEFARLFDKAGADLLHVSAGIYDSLMFISGPPAMPEAMHVPLARAIKEAVRIPVIAVGRIADPYVAEKVLEDGSADLVAFGRALLADAKFATKIYEDRMEEICKCISCRYCLERTHHNLDVRCAVNPALGRESIFDDTAVARDQKKVLVIGGGPAGMQAAISARKLGHKVTLIEKEKQLGGQLNFAVIPYYKEVNYLLEYLKTMVNKLNIEVQLGQEAGPTVIERFTPDAIIIATGGEEIRPPAYQFDSDNIVTACEALSNPKKAGRRVAVIGAGSKGCETAEYLAGKRVELKYGRMKGQGPQILLETTPVDHPFKEREVTLLEMLPDVATDAEEYSRELLLQRLKANKIKILTKARVLGIDKNRLTYFDLNSLRTETIEADTFVLAVGIKSKADLLNQLKWTRRKVLAVGDCVRPGKIPEAIYQGALAATQI